MVRPRRSAVEVDYRLPPKDGSDLTLNDQIKSKQRMIDSDDDDSVNTGDEYDPIIEQLKQDKSLEKGKQRESSDDSHNSAENTGEESIGEEEEELEDDLSNNSGSVVTKRRRQKSTIVLPVKKTVLINLNTVQYPPEEVGLALGRKKGSTKKLTNRGPLTSNDAEFHPFYEPPTRTLQYHQEPENINGSIEYGKALMRNERLGKAKEMSNLAFGPERTALQDLGWNKGKWNQTGINKRWGGWYDQIKSEKSIVLSTLDALVYHPGQLYLSQPTPIHLEAPIVAPNAEENDEPLENPEDDEDGSIKVWIGLQKKKGGGQKKVTLKKFETKRLDQYINTKPGHIFNAGGPISGVDWLPRADTTTAYTSEFLAVSTLGKNNLDNAPFSKPSMLQIWSLDTSIPSDLHRSTSPDQKGVGMKFELGLCISIGDAFSLKWCPKGGEVDGEAEVEEEKLERLGILGGTFTDGSISLFMVPHPRSVGNGKAKKSSALFVTSKPILKMQVADSRALSMDWASHETIASGHVNGSVAIWFVGDALRSGKKSVRPIQYFNVHPALIRSVVFVKIPPFSKHHDGKFDLEAEPTMLITCSYDGLVKLVNLDNPLNSAEIMKERTIKSAVAYEHFSGAAIVEDADNRTRAAILTPLEFATTKKLMGQKGSIWDYATSNFHPFIAAASADGTCKITNALRGARRKKTGNFFSRNLFAMDFNRILGEYRMLDNLAFDEKTSLVELKGKPKPKSSKSKSKSKAVAPSEEVDTTPLEDRYIRSWTPHVGVLRTNWHPSIRRAALVVSGMACGLGRVDWVVGTHEAGASLSTTIEEITPKSTPPSKSVKNVSKKDVAAVDIGSTDDEAIVISPVKNKGKGKKRIVLESDEEDELVVGEIMRPPTHQHQPESEDEIVVEKEVPVVKSAQPKKSTVKPVKATPKVVVDSSKKKADAGSSFELVIPGPPKAKSKSQKVKAAVVIPPANGDGEDELEEALDIVTKSTTARASRSDVVKIPTPKKAAVKKDALKKVGEQKVVTKKK